nr:BMP family ABC transporter substrate-binding protein [Deinococcota bacterium]
DLVMARLAAMNAAEPAFDPFEGPITDRHGNLVVPEGVRLNQQELEAIEWAVEGVSPTAPWPNEP